MKNGIVLFFLIALIVMASGCITGRVNDVVNADGSINRHFEIDKVGLLANANCDYIISMMSSSQNVTYRQTEIARKNCKESDEKFFFDVFFELDEEMNPIKLVDKDDVIYLRYESENNYLPTTVRMPSTVTSHNGELIDAYTVAFKGSVVPSMDSGTVYFVESEQPSPFDLGSLFLPIVIIAILVVLGLLIKRNHDKKFVWDCEYCSKSFSSKRACDKHEKKCKKTKKHKDEDFEWECEKCGKAYPTKKECDEHEKHCKKH